MSFIRGQTISQQLLADFPGVPLAAWPAGSLRGSPVPAWPIELQDWLHPMETRLGRHHLPRVHCCCLKPEQNQGLLSWGEGCLATNSVSHLFTNCCQLVWTLPHRCEARPRAAQRPKAATSDEAFLGTQGPSLSSLAPLLPYSLLLPQRAESARDPKVDPWGWLPSSLMPTYPPLQPRRAKPGPGPQPNREACPAGLLRSAQEQE